MGYGFNKDSQFETWGNLSDYSSKEQLDELEKLPLPTGKKINYSEEGLDLSYEIVKFGESYNESQKELTPDQIKLFNSVFRKIKTNNIKLYNYKYSDKFLEIINNYNTNIDYKWKKHSVKNSVISRIKQVISSPSNQILANEPIEISMWHKAADKALARKGDPDLLSSWDMISAYKQQKDAAVGKEDVGIGANGLKVYFNLTNYYNTWFNKGEINKDLDKYIFNKSFYMGFEDNPVMNFRYISDGNFSKDKINFINSLYESEVDVYKVNSALSLSGFVSAATDNAKELLMAKINATPDLASIHIYMLFLGFTPDQVSEYMNSDLVDYIIKGLESDIFTDDEPSNIPKLVNEYKQLNSGDPNINEKTETFLDLFQGGQEFKILASILKVNQKTSANIKELNKFLNNFESAIYFRENSIFSKNLKNVNDLDNLNTTIDTIFKNNFNLIDNEENREKAKQVLIEASNVEVYYTDNGIEKKKFVSLIGGNFDFRYYHNDKNTEYKRLSIEYYNLLKNTVNIFHVIENSPHFKEMINGLKLSHEMLNSTSKKYNFLFSKSRDIIRKRSLDLHINSDEYNKIKTILGNTALPVKITDEILSKLAIHYDKQMVSSWLKSNDRTLTSITPIDLSFNVQDLLKLAGLKKVTLYTDDSSKSYPKNTNDVNYVKVVNVDDNEPFIVSLNSDYGIANFKVLMDKVIFKILEDSDSKLSDSLRLMKVKNAYGLFTTQIVPSFPISQLNSPVNADKFQTLLNEFNDVDRTSRKKINNASGKLLKWKDLFFTYNLLVNNESYGDKRLTPIFEDYVKDKNTLGYNYLNYASDVDSGKIDIFDFSHEFELLSENLEENKKEELFEELLLRQENDILFQAFQKNGELRIKTPNLKLSKKGGVIKLTLANSDFVVNTSMEITSSKDQQIYTDVLDFINILKSGNLIITFNCI